VHSNGTLSLTGNPCAAMYYSSAGSVPVTGNSVGTGAACSSADLDSRPDSSPLPVPDMNPDTYKAQADYWLESNGQIYNPATGLPFPVGAVPGWSFSNMTWSSNSQILAGTYWVNGNVVMGGSPGSPGSPLPVTILAKLSVDIGGSPRTVPDLLISGPGQQPAGISVIAGTDLKMAGNSSQVFTGIYYAGHQLDVSGSVTINGQLLAANRADSTYLPGNTNLVPLDASGRMVITGSPTINFNGMGIVGSRAIAWRECRGSADPLNPCGPLWGGNP